MTVFAEDKLSLQLYFHSKNLKTEKINISEIMPKLESSCFENLSLSPMIGEYCFLAIFLNSKYFLMYWIRITERETEIVKTPFRIEFAVACTNFVWRESTLFFNT